jgi:ubiquinone/menaquinone biosynthesis C-methylase UbiE
MSEYFEKAAIMWDSDPNRLNMTKAIAQAMKSRLNPNGTELLLDYGTGTGLIALQLYNSVKKVIAVDSAKNMLAILREKLEDREIVSIEPLEWSIDKDFQKLPLFDIITVSMTLHHIQDTMLAASVFYLLLHPGGKIAIADLDPDNGEFHEPGIAEHEGFDRDKLGEIFRNAGFTEVQFDDIATITKLSSKTKIPKEFSIFLMTAQRQE